MDANKRLLIALATIAVGGGTLMLPGDADQVATLLKDRSFTSALSLAEKRAAAGDDSPQILLALHELRSHFGDVDGATKAIASLAAKQPKNMELQLQLADHYFFTHDMGGYIATLERIAAEDIGQPAVQILLGHYRFRGDVAAETHLLRRLVDAGQPTPSILSRLGLLLAARGEPEKAIELLTRFDTEAGPSARKERLTLFQLLLDRGEYKRAHERAVAWTNNWRDPEIALDLADRLRAAGQSSLAITLASRTPSDRRPVDPRRYRSAAGWSAAGTSASSAPSETDLRRPKQFNRTTPMRRECGVARESCHEFPVPDDAASAAPGS
jgi:thioredoxin-like negative regulator of GroEL